MENARKEQNKLLSRDVIKYIAMFTMLLNHTAQIFLVKGTLLCEVLTAIGYFTAASMIYFLIEGFAYTHSKKKYIMRLFLFAMISEIPFCLAFTNGKIIEFCGLNMLYTLCLCFGIVWVFDGAWKMVWKVCFAVLVILFSFICDWGLLAPIFTLLFMWAGKSGKKTGIAFGISTALFGLLNFIGGIGLYPAGVNLLYAFLDMAGMAAAGICIIFLYNGKRMEKGRNFSKWFFYIFYPAHLLVLGILRLI